MPNSLTDAMGYSPGSPFYRAPSAGGYNVNPSPLSGSGPYGQVPGLLSLPNPAGDLGQQFSALGPSNDAAGQALLAKLQGKVSPGTTNALQTAAAQLGVQNGMPGMGPGSFNMHNLFGNIAGFSENQQQQGIQDYNALIPTISRTQTVSPELQSEIASRNALHLAAPNPQQSQSLAQQLFNNYLGSMRSGGQVSGLPAGRGTGADFVRQPFASDAANPMPIGGIGRLPDPYANQSNFGGYGGVPSIGRSSFGGTGFDFGNELPDLGYFYNNPSFYAGGADMRSPAEPLPGGSYQFPGDLGYDSGAVSNAQLNSLINSGGGGSIDDIIDEYGF